MDAISWRRAETVPTECQSMGARSENDSRFLESSRRTPSRCSGLVSCITRGRSSSIPPDVVEEGCCWAVCSEDMDDWIPTPTPTPNPPWEEWGWVRLAVLLDDEKREGMLTLDGGLLGLLWECEWREEEPTLLDEERSPDPDTGPFMYDRDDPPMMSLPIGGIVLAKMLLLLL